MFMFSTELSRLAKSSITLSGEVGLVLLVGSGVTRVSVHQFHPKNGPVRLKQIKSKQDNCSAIR